MAEVELPYVAALTTYLSYGLLFIFGHLRDFARRYLKSLKAKDPTPAGYAPLTSDFEDFYTRRLYHRIRDCWDRPICSAPDAWIDVVERVDPSSRTRTLKRLEKSRRCLNLGSYNYLGFAASDEYCTERVIDSCKTLGWSGCSSRMDVGTTKDHVELERLVATFVGKEDAIVYGMGFATNSSTIPALAKKGTLVISDALNHTSIVAGVRGSGAKVKVFRHNDSVHLEKVLRESIAEGQPRTHRPWKKIIVIVEGIYSMEGEMCNLAEIVAVKKKYKAYLYLDEAHSIGALGNSGKGVCDQLGVDPADVDIMMGTFTKSFGSCGGYIAASRDVVEYLRQHSPASCHATAMSPPAVQQALSAIHVLLGMDGTDRGKRKLAQLRDNSNFMRAELQRLGMEVLGDWDSPIMPVMLYQPAKIPAFSRLCFDRNMAVVVVGFPATPLLLSRTRMCISAAHSKEDLREALVVLEEVGEQCDIMYTKSHKSSHTVGKITLSTKKIV